MLAEVGVPRYMSAPPAAGNRYGARLRRTYHEVRETTMSSVPKLPSEPADLNVDAASLRRSILNHIRHTQGKHPAAATRLDEFVSVARTTRDRLFDRWTRTWARYGREQPKRVYYLSMEYLLGRLLEDALLNMGVLDDMRAAVDGLSRDLSVIAEQEHDAGLGNGGLGRLAACFLDSMATLGIAGMGYGIRYEYGIFKQAIVGGAQVERPDNWLRYGNRWEVMRPERMYSVHYGGRVIQYTGPSGRPRREWTDTQEVMAMAYDIPVPGYGNGVVNTLRLWSAKATREFELSYFNRGDYIKAVQDKSETENISRVLYPNDDQLAGKELRLKQEYFLVSATLQDALRRHLESYPDLTNLPDKAVFQLNDTHPALAIAELMRLLVDCHNMTWSAAWDTTRRSMAYTNHTILPEALERWPSWLMERLLPRHLQIIHEINHEFLQVVRQQFPGDDQRVRRMSIVEEGAEKYVRMAHLAIVGASRVNGVSGLHTTLLKERIFSDFSELYPGKIINQTNGVTPRRWLQKCNPELSKLITSCIGDGWKRDLSELVKLTPFAEDAEVRHRWRAVKRQKKEQLAAYLRQQWRMDLDPTHIVDTHVKRIHEYKRQLLNILHVTSLFLSLRDDASREIAPRTFIFSGKAAPGYDLAKRIIWLINSVARLVNEDAHVRQFLRILFVPNYGVTSAEHIIVASDISEQISAAGTEASGTGNMKFALNGALTLGTLDGANIEIRDAVGEENMFLFGLTSAEAQQWRADGYDPMQMYYATPDLRRVIDAIANGMFSPEDPSRFRPIVDALLRGGDPYFVLADFTSYARCHKTVDTAYADVENWTRKSIFSVAHMGRFSSDETIRGYARDIWNIDVPR